MRPEWKGNLRNADGFGLHARWRLRKLRSALTPNGSSIKAPTMLTEFLRFLVQTMGFTSGEQLREADEVWLADVHEGAERL